VTVPLPDPLLATASEKVSGVSSAKAAVTLLLALMLIAQVPVPAQAPVQPVNFDPAAGLAVSVTAVPASYE
jgi:hypothetical protein